MITVEDVVRRATEVTFDRPMVTNVFRSVLVEAIVSAALPGWEWCSADYASYDFKHSDGTRLEVKQSAARQTWFTGRSSRSSWDIRPRTGYWKDGLTWIPEPGRNADIYVLGLHPLTDESADHRNPQQWLFFVIAASALPQTKAISEAGARRLTTPVGVEELSSAVEAVRRSFNAARNGH